jgi:hypothetical protein
VAKQDRYRFNIYQDGVLIGIASSRARAKKVARQFGGSFRHVARSKPLHQHARTGVGVYANPAQQWVIEQQYSYGWDDVPWHADGSALVFDTREDAETELLSLLTSAEGEELLDAQSYRVAPAGQRNPCFPRIKYRVRYELGKARPWAVYKQQAERASRRFRLKSEAVEYARGRALDARYSQLTIEGRHGEVRDIKYYGALDADETRESPPAKRRAAAKR